MLELRVMGFDYGTKRIGVATGQTLTNTATALTQLSVQQGLPAISDIQKLLDEWQPDVLIVGLPLNMDDSRSKSSASATHFANWLKKKFKLPVHLIDERLSTREARERIEQPGKKYTKERLNSVAAQVIVETWLMDQ